MTKMKACVVFSCLLFAIFCSKTFGDDFSIVNDVLDHLTGDVIAAFGDFNADKLIDFFVINQAGHGVDLLLVREKKDYERRTLLSNDTIPPQRVVSGMMLADFDGDVLMDVLVLLKNSTQPADLVEMCLYWGNGSGLDLDNPFRFNNESFKGEPVLFDFNADMIPDLLTTRENKLNVWQAIAHARNFSTFSFNSTFQLSTPHSSAFVDLDRNYNADLILTVEENKKFLEFLNNDFVNVTTIDINTDMKVGQSSFADFNQDGYIDHVVPACRQSDDHKCKDSVIYIHDGRNRTQWQLASSGLSDWEFVWDGGKHLPTQFNLELPVTLRVGDYDMDGFPDLLAVMVSPKFEMKPFLLRNMPNETGEGRKFVMQAELLPNVINSSILAAFYDFGEDGMLDILVTSLSREGQPYTVLIRNNLALDTCFLKVTVISGLCSEHCNKPYGVNVPGPTVLYETIHANGNPQTSCAGQLSQSAHFALQLPFVSFGLGPTPNFIEQIGVGMPMPNHKYNRTKFWTQIIPNAQLIVNPKPIDDISGWRMQLFVVPSQQIYLTGIALLSTCVFMALIVGILLWNERREDKLEKKNESQKFHFDAM